LGGKPFDEKNSINASFDGLGVEATVIKGMRARATAMAAFTCLLTTELSGRPR
jgi:hypothetical protein